jgi:hypothetical protein
MMDCYTVITARKGRIGQGAAAAIPFSPQKAKGRSTADRAREHEDRKGCSGMIQRVLNLSARFDRMRDISARWVCLKSTSGY